MTMSIDAATPDAPAESRFNVQPSVVNHFAWARTLFGLQRTLMAAVRTSVSLIGFGFTVAQFFEHLQRDVPENLRVMGTGAPRTLGVMLIATGIVSLAIFTWQYRRAVQYLRSAEFASLATGSARP